MRYLCVWCDFGQPIYSSSGLCSCVTGEFAWYVALELVGSWVVLGFSVGMEAFDELLSFNVPWIQEFFGIHRIWT